MVRHTWLLFYSPFYIIGHGIFVGLLVLGYESVAVG